MSEVSGAKKRGEIIGGRKCTICAHQRREEIDRQLVTGASLRDVAGQFNVSRSALHRHKENHIPAALVDAQKAQEASQAGDLLADVTDLRDKAISILDRAERAGRLQVALNGIREARECLKLLASLEGVLWERQKVEVKSEQTPKNYFAKRVIADPVATKMAHDLLARIAEADKGVETC